MRRFYQTEWQNIKFRDFVEPSSSRLADSEFYQAFYQEFFKRFSHWDELEPEWRKSKVLLADFVIARAQAGDKVLSVGCGLGVMEHYIHARAQLDLFIHEAAPAALRWIRAEIPKEHSYIGSLPACLPRGAQFDLIYLSAVDYALDDDALIHLLTSLQPFLNPGGQCLLVSASFEDILTFQANALRHAKAFAAAALDVCGLRSRGQFWGWVRTQKDYWMLMRRAGYNTIEEGFVSSKRNDYWIAGRISAS